MSEKSPISMPPKVVVARQTPTVSEVTLINGDKIDEKSYSKETESLHFDLAKEIDVEAQTQTTQRKPKVFASTRYTILTLYRRLFTLVFCANIAMFVYLMSMEQKLLALVNATAANLLACGLARQPLVVNAIFVIVFSMLRSAPLLLRQVAAKVYHYGGVHSGCGVASLVWYVGFVGVLSHQYWKPSADGPDIGISAGKPGPKHVVKRAFFF